MSDSREIIDEKTDELREMLRSSSGYNRTVERPTVIVGCKLTESGALLATHAPGPVTIVTFTISHFPDDERHEEMIQKAKGESVCQAVSVV